MTAVTHPQRLTYYDDGKGMSLLRQIAKSRGISAAAALRQLVREEAERKGIASVEVS